MDTNQGMDVKQNDGWFDIALPEDRIRELIEFFSKKKINTFTKISPMEHPLGQVLKSTIPVEIQDGVCVALAIDESDPSRLLIMAGPTPRINGIDRLSIRLKMPGFNYPNPKKFVSRQIGSIHAHGDPVKMPPRDFKSGIPHLPSKAMEQFIKEFESELFYASSHELQRKLDVYTFRPATVAMAGIGAAIVVSSFGCDPVTNNVPLKRPAAVSTTIGGR